MKEWHELKPSCYGIIDLVQFNFLQTFSSLHSEWDPIPEYMCTAKRKEYALARKIAWIMAATLKRRTTH